MMRFYFDPNDYRINRNKYRGWVNYSGVYHRELEMVSTTDSRLIDFMLSNGVEPKKVEVING